MLFGVFFYGVVMLLLCCSKCFLQWLLCSCYAVLSVFTVLLCQLLCCSECFFMVLLCYCYAVLSVFYSVVYAVVMLFGVFFFYGVVMLLLCFSECFY